MSRRSFYMTLDSVNRTSGTSDDFITHFNPNLLVNDIDDYEVALCTFHGWYTWRNIEDEYDNTAFYYNNGSVDCMIDIPEGFYGIEDLNAFMQAEMKALGDYSIGTGPNGANEYYITLIPNYQLNHTQMVISGGYSVDLTQNRLAEWLGFNLAVYLANATV